MADKKITALTEGTSLANGDIVPFVDVSDTTDAPSGTTKKITKANLVTDLYLALGSSLDADYQPLDSQLTSIAGLTPGAEGRIITSNGLGGYQISTPGDVRSYLNVENGADVTDATNVDAAGATMNSDTNVGSNGWVLQAADSDTEDDTKVGSWTKTRNYVESSLGTTKTFTAAENISSGDAVSLAGTDSSATMVSNTGDTASHNGWNASGNWFAQPFTTSSDTKYIYSVTLELDANNTTTNVVVASIRADSSGPTGADISGITGSVSVDLTNGGDLVTEIVFDEPVPVSGSTTYHVVLRNSSQTAQDTRNTEHAGSGTAYTSANSGSTWSSATTTTYHIIKDINYEIGQIYKADASADNYLANGFIGFATAGITATESGTVQISGKYTTSGLVAGAMYFVSDTAGSIGFNAGTQSRRVGRALSSTELLIQPFDSQ